MRLLSEKLPRHFVFVTPAVRVRGSFYAASHRLEHRRTQLRMPSERLALSIAGPLICHRYTIE